VLSEFEIAPPKPTFWFAFLENGAGGAERISTGKNIEILRIKEVNFGIFLCVCGFD
jgi:hypothetical protein